MILETVNIAEQILSECKRRGVTVFVENGKLGYKPKARMTRGLLDSIQQNKGSIMAMLSGIVEEPPEPTLEDPPTPTDALTDTRIYELLVTLKLRDFEILATDDNLTVRPASALMPEEIKLLKEHKDEAIRWVRGMEEHCEATRHIKAAIEEWLEEDEDARIWVRTLPERGEDYARAQLWQVLDELRGRGILVPKDEEEVVVFLMIEVAWRLVREEG